MEQFLKTLIGKQIDAFCGGTSSVRGEVVKVENGLLHLKDEDEKTCYVAVHLIIAVWEKPERDRHPGFVVRH